METLDNADWRIDSLNSLAEPWHNPWSNQIVPIGTLIKKVTIARWNKKQTVTLTIPNASSLFLSVATRAYAAATLLKTENLFIKARDTEFSFPESAAFTYLEHMFEAVICAHTAVEAYVNEILPTDRTYVRATRGGPTEILTKDEIERRASLTEKVATFLPEALGVRSPKGIHRAYSDLQALTKIRDRLIHMKSADRKSSGPEIDTIWHQLLTCGSPVDQALSVIRYFANASSPAPRWLTKIPKR